MNGIRGAHAVVFWSESNENYEKSIGNLEQRGQCSDGSGCSLIVELEVVLNSDSR